MISIETPFRTWWSLDTGGFGGEGMKAGWSACDEELTSDELNLDAAYGQLVCQWLNWPSRDTHDIYTEQLV